MMERVWTKTLSLPSAIKNELVEPIKINHLTDQEIFDFIFHPGFSTAEEVTSVSGRGVGMDVVKSHIDKLHGEIHINSEKGKGTEITITIPVQKTLLVEKFMIGAYRGDFIAFPSKSVIAVENIDSEKRRISFQIENIILKVVKFLSRLILTLEGPDQEK